MNMAIGLGLQSLGQGIKGAVKDDEDQKQQAVNEEHRVERDDNAQSNGGFMDKMENLSASDRRIKDYVFGAYGKYPHESSMNKVLKVKILQGLI